jgi:uncharacterized membrane protein
MAKPFPHTLCETSPRSERLKELWIMGFSDRHRALEVLPQLRRLHFEWSDDLRDAVAVEVDGNGRFRLFQGLLLDSMSSAHDTAKWRALLNAIVPFPVASASDPAYTIGHMEELTVHVDRWLRQISFDYEFLSDAAALLRPGSSALMAVVQNGRDTVSVMSGFSHFVLHTPLEDQSPT